MCQEKLNISSLEFNHSYREIYAQRSSERYWEVFYPSILEVSLHIDVFTCTIVMAWLEFYIGGSLKDFIFSGFCMRCIILCSLDPCGVTSGNFSHCCEPHSRILSLVYSDKNTGMLQMVM